MLLNLVRIIGYTFNMILVFNNFILNASNFVYSTIVAYAIMCGSIITSTTLMYIGLHVHFSALPVGP